MQKPKQKRALARALIKISPKTLKLLNTLLPFLLCAFLWFGVSYIKSALVNPVYAEYTFRPISENLLVSLCLLIGGAAIFDCSLARGDFDK